MNTQALDIYGVVLILVLAVVMPLVGVRDFRRLVGWLEEGRADARTHTYRWIIATEWSATLAFTIWWLADGRGLARLGLVPAATGWQWLAVGLGLAASLFLVGQMVMVLRSPKALRKVLGQAGELASLGPQTDGEVRLFNLVSITAGVCEEIVYRGALLAVLTEVVAIWPAVALSSIVFGLGHAYQGPAGVVKTSLVGAVMALLAVFSGSLFMPIVLHIVIDITSGRMLAAAQVDEASRAPGTVNGCSQPAPASSLSIHSPPP